MDPTDTSPILPIQLLHVRLFLIPTRPGWVLVDAGLPYCEGLILRRIRAAGVDPTQIHTIMLTHGHLDHIGCLGPLQRLSRAQVVCHASLAPDLAAGLPERAVPRVPLWKAINQPAHKLLSGKLEPVQADVVFEAELDLEAFGLRGRLLHTPGHSPGSISLLLDSGLCLIGDCLRETTRGKYDTGLFYEDLDQLKHSLEVIAGQNPRVIYLSHGTTLPGGKLAEYVARHPAP